MHKATIYFEDHGQDFLEWDIEILSAVEARVIDSRPFQASVWTGCHILYDDKMHAGEHVVYTRNFSDANTIKYPIERIERHAH